MAEYIYSADPIGEGEYSHTLVRELVRCGECKRFERNGEKEHGNCAYHLALAYLTDYCSWGERRADD